MKIAAIRRDGGTQPRVGMDAETVSEYAEAMAGGEAFPPVTVYYDGNDHWLADGFHRVNAALNAGMTDIAADVRQGTRRDAVLHSVGANAQHGLRRTNADKRRAVLVLLNDDEWRRWGDREIARRCAVDHVTVGRLRETLSGELHQIDGQQETRLVERGGTVYEQKVRKETPQPDRVEEPPTLAEKIQRGEATPEEQQEYTEVNAQITVVLPDPEDDAEDASRWGDHRAATPERAASDVLFFESTFAAGGNLLEVDAALVRAAIGNKPQRVAHLGRIGHWLVAIAEGGI